MPKLTRKPICDVCGEPIDQSDFHELTLTRKYVTERPTERWGRVWVVKDRRAKREVPAMKLCETCAGKEKERMAYLLKLESE